MLGSPQSAPFDDSGSRSAPSTSPPLEAVLATAQRVASTWRNRAFEAVRPESAERWLLHAPDVGPTCEMLLADQLFHDLEPAERAGLIDFVRGSQDATGAWLDPAGRADLSLTVLGWWARRLAGDDPGDESMLRAQRVVHALGGAQRADFSVRLWLAMGGQIPWSYLPTVPGELFLLPEPTWFSPARFSPWAREMLTPYFIIARAPARLQLPDATPLLLQRGPEKLVAPRLTRPGLVGDVLQAVDRSLRLSRKLPRGPLPRWAFERATAMLTSSQQRHGGWFSFRPTVLSLVALRVLGLRSDDERIVRGLGYLRRARGRTVVSTGAARGEPAFAQGTAGPRVGTLASLIAIEPKPSDVNWLLRQELTGAGPWQQRADVSAGGWPTEARSNLHLDLEATCSALDALYVLPSDQSGSGAQSGPAWASTRRAIDVLLAMQENDGGFPRFERGESRVWLRRVPWRDADFLAFGEPVDLAHIRLTASAITALGRTGFRLDDDRVLRGVRWLERHAADAHDHSDVETLGALAHCAAAVCPSEHPFRASVEQRLRAGQHEDGSFGSLQETAHAIRGLLALGRACVQTTRAVRYLVERVERDPSVLERYRWDGSDGPILEPESGAGMHHDGLGLSLAYSDPSAAARDVARALEAFVRRGGTLTAVSVQ